MWKVCAMFALLAIVEARRFVLVELVDDEDSDDVIADRVVKENYDKEKDSDDLYSDLRDNKSDIRDSKSDITTVRTSNNSMNNDTENSDNENDINDYNNKSELTTKFELASSSTTQAPSSIESGPASLSLLQPERVVASPKAEKEKNNNDKNDKKYYSKNLSLDAGETVGWSRSTSLENSGSNNGRDNERDRKRNNDESNSKSKSRRNSRRSSSKRRSKIKEKSRRSRTKSAKRNSRRSRKNIEKSGKIEETSFLINHKKHILKNGRDKGERRQWDDFDYSQSGQEKASIEIDGFGKGSLIANTTKRSTFAVTKSTANHGENATVGLRHHLISTEMPKFAPTHFAKTHNSTSKLVDDFLQKRHKHFRAVTIEPDERFK